MRESWFQWCFIRSKWRGHKRVGMIELPITGCNNIINKIKIKGKSMDKNASISSEDNNKNNSNSNIVGICYRSRTSRRCLGRDK